MRNTWIFTEELSTRKKWLLIAPLAILALMLFIAAGGEIVMRLWNWLLPPLFGWRQLTCWQALGILALCRILFGGFGSHGFGRSNVRRRIKERMAERMEKRCANMTPEERERFRQRMRERFGFGPSTGENKAE